MIQSISFNEFLNVLFNSEHVFVGGEFAFKTFSATAFFRIESAFLAKKWVFEEQIRIYIILVSLKF